MILWHHDIRRCLPGQDAVTRERDNYYILSFIRWVGRGRREIQRQRQIETKSDRDRQIKRGTDRMRKRERYRE